MLKIKIVILLLATVKNGCWAWGFAAHKHINHQAVFSLPEGALFGFLKANIAFVTDNAINADKRRYTVEAEACRHFIDLDAYDSVHHLPKYWNDAVKKHTADSLHKHGILPWHIFKMKTWLTKAMRDNNAQETLKLAADIGHYIADAHVPLHTTRNYDGQLTNQKGIHALWETRLPELFSHQYNFWIGKAEYITDVQALAWKAVLASHAGVDSVLSFEAETSLNFPPDQKYAFEERNGTFVRVYSKEFSEKYAQKLDGQVERQMQKAIKMVADTWYTCWIEAGQPDFSSSSPSMPHPVEEDNSRPIDSHRFLESHRCGDHDHVATKPINLTKK